MLDAMQNSILNKPDSILDKRPNSPSADINKLESKFENMFAKQAKAKTQKEDQESNLTQTIDDKNPLSKALQGKINKTDGKNTTQTNTKNEPSDKNPSQMQKAQGSNTKPTSQKTQTPAPASFDFKDTASEDSKIGLQEKIAKSSKENKPKENNPLVEALNTPLNTTNAASKNSSIDSKPQAPRIASMPMPQAKIPQEEMQGVKTLADVQNLAQTKGLNPHKMSLEAQGANAQSLVQEALETQVGLGTKPVKPKNIPASAKETISYEYENNVDRIAIVQRGTKKPKNITSKISNEYPTKKTDESKGDIFSLKDAPQLR